MKRYIRSATKPAYTSDFTSNEEWAYYITTKLRLSDEDSEMLEHDLNNLRADEWLEVIEGKLPKKEVEQFIRYFGLEADDDFDDEDVEGCSLN